MVQVSEMRIFSNAMKWLFEEQIQPICEKLGYPDLLDYRPKPKSTDSRDVIWKKENPTTGLIFLKDYPNLELGWTLVKFRQNEDLKYGKHTKYDTIKITNENEFYNAFGVYPGNDFVFTPDTYILLYNNKQVLQNQNPNLDFQESAYDLYTYINNIKVTREKFVERCARLDEMMKTVPDIIKNGRVDVGKLYSITGKF